MMKTSPRQYASALFVITESRSGEELRKAIKQFVKLLALKKDLGQANKIISRFTEIYNQENNLASLEIKSARPLSSKTLSEIEAVFKKELEQNIEITETIDPKLLGGLLIRHQDTVIDGSLAGILNNLRKSLTK